MFKGKFNSVIFVLLSSSMFAQDDHNNAFIQANTQYEKGHYDKAATLYEEIVEDGLESAELYYNLGNAYYRLDNVGLSILYYEKARKLSPTDEDILTNLAFANQKVEDEIDAVPVSFLTNWLETIASILTEKGWSLFFIGLFIVSLLLLVLYILSSTPNLKRLFFYSFFLLFVVGVCCFFLAWFQYYNTKNTKEAVIVSPATTVLSSPDSEATKLFVLHEGTKVSITDETNEWVELKLADGNVGWLLKKDLRKI